ncbi:MAG: hypothetical protein K9N23_22490 [Akkermansiaceae bacterium]|nr:hypothetical protein [Akkermansiaceae bacterium]
MRCGHRGRFDPENIGHHLKFDLSPLHHHGIEVDGPFFDTMLADALVVPVNAHPLIALAGRWKCVTLVRDKSHTTMKKFLPLIAIAGFIALPSCANQV